MSEPLPASPEPVHVAARRMRWFRAAFGAVVARVSETTGTRFDVDEGALAECFVTWLRKVEARNPHDEAARRAYFEHAAGMMLRELIVAAPLKARDTVTDPDPRRPEHYWPEGFCYTVYCMNVYAAAVRQDYGEDVSRASAFDDLRQWWSFRENAGQDPSVSVAFFKMFAGSRPNWRMPDAFAWAPGHGIEGGPIPAGINPPPNR